MVAREGERLFSPPPQMLRKAASGDRFFERRENLNVAVAPILYGGELAGGVVFVTRQWEAVVYEPFLRSGLEAAVLASLIGGGLMFLLAAMLSRRVERLSSGARLMERGDLSHRIEPGFGDELGALAKTLNSMAANLEESFGRLAEKDATLGAILDNLSEGVVATDARGTVVFANPAGRTMLGMGEEDAELPNPWEDFDLREAVASSALKREGGKPAYGEASPSCGSSSSTCRTWVKVAPNEWLTSEEAATYLKKTPKAFEKVMAQGEIPKHYITERGILFSRKELDEWLLER